MTKNTYGYMRVSSKDQHEHRQLNELLDYGIPREQIYMDKLSGKDFNRPAYQHLIYQILKPHDLLVVKSIDRLGRNYKEIINEWKVITNELNADIKILDMPLLDTSVHRDLIGTLISDIVLQLLSFIAENERETIRQRQKEGIAAAKKRGVKFGRPPIPYPSNFEIIYTQWRNKEITPQEAFQKTKLPDYLFYKRVKRYEWEKNHHHP
ncbi:MAG: recombinase family protein [Acetivibrio sp.]